MHGPVEQAGAEQQVQVLRPLLPAAERLLPYLRRIDERRVYANWGPLATELEGRLAGLLELPPGGVTSAGSGTSALVGAILATAGPATRERPLALVPALTFVATAIAVERCGYRPYLAEVDAASWLLDPARALEHPALDEVGVVVPVAAFGRPVPQEGWQRFAERTGIPVVIDGAASLDRVCTAPRRHLGALPVALSFHATKAFATGEGGAVAAADPRLVLRVAQALNFGFEETRESRTPSTNGKLSEYHAAVGLAELDGWTDKLRALVEVGERYRRLAAEAGLGGRLLASPEIGASYVLFRCRDAAEAERTGLGLARAGVDHRRWYDRGLHRHAHFAGAPRDALELTDRLAPCLLGLPLAPDLPDAAARRVIDALAEAVR